MNIIDRIVTKVTSGQWILTVACSFAFAWCAVNQLISNEAVVGILTLVFKSYFDRDRNTTDKTTVSDLKP